MEYSDMLGRVDKLAETTAVMSERLIRVEDEQRAMRGSIDQLTGEVRQLDKRLGDLGTAVDTRLRDMNTSIDTRLNDMNTSIDRRLNDMNASFDKRLSSMQWTIGIIATLLGLYLAGITFPLVRFIIMAAKP